MQTVHLKNLLKASCLVMAGGYAYLLTTDTFSNFFIDVVSALAKPMVVAAGLCAIAVVYIGVFHVATRFLEGILLLATCVIASGLSCMPLNVIEPNIGGVLEGVLFGLKSGLTVAILASLWCARPRIGPERKRLLLRSGAAAIVCVLIFGVIGWWRTKLTSLDFFTVILYPASFAVIFVCAWLAAAPTALMTVNKKDLAESRRATA